MSNPLVSICVPVYNVAGCVETCVKSLLAQDYTPLELVFVNDSSTDGSWTLIKKLLENADPSIRVVLHENSSNRGLAYTRKLSILLAHGEYVACVDSDDYIDSNYVSELVREAVRTYADIVDTSYFVEADGKSNRYMPYSPSGDCYLTDALEDKLQHVCMKLIRRQLIVDNDCFAPEGLDYLEDRIAILQLAYYSRVISRIDTTNYHYVLRSSSVSHTKLPYHFECMVRFWKQAESLLEQWQLADRYADCFLKQKMATKVELLHFAKDVEVCRQYVDLFGDEDFVCWKQLPRGQKLTAFCCHYRLWGLLRCYRLLATIA